MDLQNLGATNTLVLTDDLVVSTPAFTAVADSLKKHNVIFDVYDRVRVEPTDLSFLDAISVAREGRFDSFVAVGGGSSIDTAKAAAVFASNPSADLFDYAPLPFGKGLIPDKPMLPLIAVPTTAGTGSETTGAAVFDIEDAGVKAAIRGRCLKPLLALIDPLNVKTMPRNVAVYSGFDVLCHALESYTAKPFIERSPRPVNPKNRPLYQGSNPISDVWAREALRIMQKYFVRAVTDGEDEEARSNMQLASAFAGVGFGNAGVHLCHGLSYAISGQVKGFRDSDYPPTHSLVPHGLSVVTTACADFKFTGTACPKRHLEAARLLGAEVEDIHSGDYAGQMLGDCVREYMKLFKVPNGLSELGFDSGDVDRLSTAAMKSLETLKVSPKEATKDIIAGIYEQSMTVY